MRWRRDDSVDAVVAAIEQSASDIREEARKVAASHTKMDEIAARMERLVARLTEDGKDAPG